MSPAEENPKEGEEEENPKEGEEEEDPRRGREGEDRGRRDGTRFFGLDNGVHCMTPLNPLQTRLLKLWDLPADLYHRIAIHCAEPPRMMSER